MNNILHLNHNPIWVCYKAVLEEFYREPSSGTQVSEVLGELLDEVADKFEIDYEAHRETFSELANRYQQELGDAFFDDVETLRETGAIVAVESALTGGVSDGE